MSVLLWYALAGSFAGLIAGLFGVGGGLVLVPVLVFLFQGQGVEAHLWVHLAVGTSLASIVFTSLSSVYAHHRHGAVLWPVFQRLLPGLVVGALLGAQFADWLPGPVLGKFFGVFELLVALQLALQAKPAPHRRLPGRAGLLWTGGVIGAISSVLGIGGGTLSVPFLVWCQVPMRQAVATASACGLPIAAMGALGFALTGQSAHDLPAWSSGYIYWPALLGIAGFSTAFAPLGARLAHRLPGAQLQRYFALFLALLGIRMLLN